MKLSLQITRQNDQRMVEIDALTLSGKGWLIGRKDAEILLADPLCSRRHAYLFLEDDRLQIRHLSTKNKTLVNSKPVLRASLQVGDKVKVGTSTIQITEIIVDNGTEDTAKTLTAVTSAWPDHFQSYPPEFQRKMKGHY